MMYYWLGGGKEIFEDLVSKHANSHPFPSVQNTSEVWLFSNKVINTLADLKGMKIRAAGPRCDVMNAVGGAAVTMAGGDIVPNLEKGVIDAAEYASIYSTQAVGLDEVTKYAYWHPYKATSSFWLLFINNDVYNEFPDDIKAALDDAAWDNHLWSLSWGYIEELKAMKKSVEVFGTEMLYMPPAVIESFDKAARDFFRDKAAEDAEVAMVLDSWDKFKADYGPYARWIDICDMTSWFGLWEEDVGPWYEPVEWPAPK
jgi:TRAP-type mannitol/chloroaromatic compound transport system substrate-binding protein